MEKKSPKKQTKTISKEDFIRAYTETLLMEGQEPRSVLAFVKSLDTTEAEFYKHFNSFRSLERLLWLDWFKETNSILESDEAYPHYSVREKLLAFFYTWLETLKQNRSFVLKKMENLDKRELNPTFLLDLKDEFEYFIKDLILEGKDTNEVAERQFSKYYDKAFWMQFLFIMRFWAQDDSLDFEKTDAAIEKSVNLAFDLVGQGPIDSMMDFAKFLFQNR